MVSTLDFESSDPSSNLGGTYILYKFSFILKFEKCLNKYRDQFIIIGLRGSMV